MRTVLAKTRPVDWLMVASLLLLAWFEIWVEPIFQTGMPGPRLPMTLFATVAVTPLLARQTFPLAALTVMCLGALGVAVVGDPDQSSFVIALGLIAGAYSLAAHAIPRNAFLGAGVMCATAVVVHSITFEQQTLVDMFVIALFLAAAWVVGKEVNRQRQRTVEVTERAELHARAHSLEVQAAVSAERTRIARELHDVVAHAVSVMGIQAAAARRTLPPAQTAQRDALLDVERLGREALDEMRLMLAVLRSGEDEQQVVALPGLTQLAALAEDARRTGVTVVLDVAQNLQRIPRSLQLTAYRIVQESLTNVQKHAHARSVRIKVDYYGEQLEVVIADDGTGMVGPEPGNGIIGMRERVAVHSGTLYAGPGEEQGFLVRARLPLEVVG